MNDAVRIRHYSAALPAKHSRFGPSFLPSPPTRLANPRISNRERLRLETVVTPTKQTPALRSNREKEACFQMPTNPRSQGLENVIASPRKLPRNSKNTTRLPSFSFRLKPTPTVCFVEVTESFNRTMFRLRRMPIEPIFRPKGPSFPARKPWPNVAHIFRHEALRPEFAICSELAFGSELARPNPRVSNRENDEASQSMNPAHRATHLTGL